MVTSTAGTSYTPSGHSRPSYPSAAQSIRAPRNLVVLTGDRHALARTIAPEAEQEIVGIRPGEKLHEQMIGAEDSLTTYEYADHYKILPAIHNWSADAGRIKDGVKVPEGFTYSSETNDRWMSSDELHAWIEANREKIGAI